MSCDWEGNRRSGVALAMRHRQVCDAWLPLPLLLNTRGVAQGLSKGDEHPTNTLHGLWYSLPLNGKGYANGIQTKPSNFYRLTFTFAICYRPSVCLSVCRL